MDTPENETPNPWKWGFIYYDPENTKVFVPKRLGLGWTLNFAQPLAYGALIAIVGLVFLIKYIISNYAG
ncbi:MAG: DUF5808 domain-containing protein [Mucilaginibacter sp.]